MLITSLAMHGWWLDRRSSSQSHLRMVLVGSSMGGWIMLRVALARPDRVKGMIGIAAAPDFTEKLMWPDMTADQQATLLRDGRLEIPSEYDPEPTPYCKQGL